MWCFARAGHEQDSVARAGHPVVAEVLKELNQ